MFRIVFKTFFNDDISHGSNDIYQFMYVKYFVFCFVKYLMVHNSLLDWVFRSDGNSRFECSTDLLTLVSESTGVMHRLSVDPVKASESWNHSDMCRDCVH